MHSALSWENMFLPAPDPALVYGSIPRYQIRTTIYHDDVYLHLLEAMCSMPCAVYPS